MLELAREAVEQDDLQWAATLLNHVVFAGDPSPDTRGLLREIYRNMAYRAESGIERNICLAGAQELEDGVRVLPAAGGRNAELAATLSLEDWLDAYAIRLNPSVRGVRPLPCSCNCPKAARWYRSHDKPNSRGSAAGRPIQPTSGLGRPAKRWRRG